MARPPAELAAERRTWRLRGKCRVMGSATRGQAETSMHTERRQHRHGMPSAATTADCMTRSDAALALLLALAAFALYAGFALRLAEGRLYEYYNLAFDFDFSRVLSMLTGDRPDGMGFKHPLMIALRPLGLMFLALGFAPKAAAGLAMALAGGGTVGLVFLFLRACRIALPEATALALLYAVSGAQLFTAIVTESYGFALLSLALVWLLARLSLDAPERPGLRAARLGAAVFAAGVTITNAIQPFIAEFALLWRRFGLAMAIRRMIVFGIGFSLLFVACALLLWWRPILEALQDPIATARSIWWLRTQGTEKTGPLGVLETFLVFSFVSPDFTVLPLPEGTRMLDFREWSFGTVGTVAAWAWLAFLAAGTAGGLLHPGYRPVALPILVALAANVVFHLDYQYRGSLYIYAAHTHLLVFALAAGLAPWLGPARPRLRLAYIGAVLALAVLVGATNLIMAADFSTRFDIPDTPCPAPCA